MDDPGQGEGPEQGEGAHDDAARELVTGGARLAAYRALLRNRNYRLWFLSSLGSSLGDWVGLFALQVLVISLAEPGSRLALFGLGGIMMARLLPSVFFGPVAGVLADRYDRKRLMVATDLSRGALFLGIAVIRDLPTLFTLVFVVECLSLLYMSAKDASLPVVVERRHLAEANQLNLFVSYGPLPFGAVVAAGVAAGAGLLPRIGLPAVDPTVLALLVNAATFLVAGAIIARLVLPVHGRRAEPGQTSGVIRELREGWDFVAGRPLIRALIVGVVGVFFGAGVIVTLGPEFVRTELGRSETDWYGLMTMVGAGLLIGIAIFPLTAGRIRRERVFAVTLTAAAAVAVVIATLPDFRSTQIFGFLLGALAGTSFVTGYTLLHENTDDAVRGKTFAAFYTTTRIAMFSALAIAPFVAGAIGTVHVILAGRVTTMAGVRITILLGGLVALFSAFTAGRSMLRTMRERPDESSESGLARLARGADEQRSSPGLFVAFEGVEGSGKSTQIRRLAETLIAEGRDVLVTREPGGAPLAERIRHVLLDPNAAGMQPRTEALLYAAARAEHVRTVIAPALEAGRVVLCDRYLHSSLTYQGYARGLGAPDVFEINRWAIGGVLPNAVVLLHLDPEEGLRRVAARGSRAESGPAARAQAAWVDQRIEDRFEREDVAFHRRVGEGYLELAKRERRRFLVIDAASDEETIARQIRSGLHAWLPLPASGAAGQAGGSAERGGGRPETAG